MADPGQLSRRERQVMDVVYARGEATASDVLAAMPDAPSRAAVRTFLRILEEKGHLRHRVVGREYVYVPTRERQSAGRSALRRVLSTFFGGSLESALAAHLAEPGTKLSADAAKRIRKLIDQAKREDR